MKLWHSFKKEILLATRGFYFYVEIAMAGLFLFLLLFVIPENFDHRVDEYLFYDVPDSAWGYFESELLEMDEDGYAEVVEIELDKEIISGSLYQTEENNYYVLDDQKQAISLADSERAFAGVIHMDELGEVTYTYYMQGYETDRLRNIYAVFHNESMDVLESTFEAQDVQVLHEDQVLLSDRENMLPSFLTFNGSLMGMFILASYIFLDKKEGVIKAYAVTTSPVWQYLLSKVGVITITSLVTSLIITIPVIGTQANYLGMFVFLLGTGFAASALGLVIASYFDDVTHSFGVLFGLVILLMLPNIAYFIPTWDPIWMKYIPTYAMLEGFKEILLPGGDMAYILMASFGFFIAGLVLFLFANMRFKKTLTI